MTTKLILQTDYTKETGDDYYFTNLKSLKEMIQTPKFRLLNGTDYNPKLFCNGKEVDFNFALEASDLQKTFIGKYNLRNSIKEMVNNPFLDKCKQLVFVEYEFEGSNLYDDEDISGGDEFDGGEEAIMDSSGDYDPKTLSEAVMDIFDKSDIVLQRNKNYTAYISDSYIKENLLLGFVDPSLTVYLKTALNGRRAEVRSIDLTPTVIEQIKFYNSIR